MTLILEDEHIAHIHAYRIKKKLDLKIRKIIFERAKYRCEECQKDLCCSTCGKPFNSRILQIHHEDGNENNNQLTNLLLLCKDCRLLRRQIARDRQFFMRAAKNSVDRTFSLKQKIDQDIEKLTGLHNLILQHGIDSDLVKKSLKQEKHFFNNYRSPSPFYQLWLSMKG